MSTRTPRRRNVRVDVSQPRRSPRTAAVSIGGIHPATPQGQRTTRAEFEVNEQDDEMSAPFRHAMADSDDADDAPSSAPAARKTPQKRRAVATPRRSVRKKPSLDVSDEETDVGSAAESIASNGASSESSSGWSTHHASDDEARGRMAPAPLSPILEESPKVHGKLGKKGKLASLPRINWNAGAAASQSLANRIKSFLSNLWWMCGSRLYLISSAILCWDVWLIVSLRHAMRGVTTPIARTFSGQRSSTRSAAPCSPPKVVVQSPSGRTTSTTERRYPVLRTIGLLLLVALTILALAALLRASFSSGSRSAVMSQAARQKVSSANVANASEAELKALMTGIVKEYAEEVEKRMAQSHGQVLRDIEDAVLRVLTQPTSTPYQYWDKRLSSAVDSKSNEVTLDMHQYVREQLSAADSRHDDTLKSELHQLQGSIKQQLAEMDTQRNDMDDRLLSADRQFNDQLLVVENRLLAKVSEQVSTTQSGFSDSEDVVMNKVRSVDASLRKKLDAVELLLKTLDSQSKDTAAQLAYKASESDVAALNGHVQRLETAQESNKQTLRSLDSSQGSLLGEEEVGAIAAKVVRRIAVDKGEFSELHLWLDKRYASASSSLCAGIPDCKKQLLEVLAADFRDLVKEEISALPPGTRGDIARDTVSDMITTSIDEFAADRIGRYDYALEAQGGQVYIAGTSPSFDPGVRMQLLGFNLFSLSYPPRLAISPGVLPGNCWPFAGSTGHITLVLSAKISVTHITVDHIAASLTTDGSRSSAPRAFTVTALHEQTDADGVSLGEFEYRLDSPSIQTFTVQSSPREVRYVRFDITSNQGHSDYTCLYRLRVHGHRSDLLA